MTDDQSPHYAIIRIRNGNNHAWPIVERVHDGWQSGAHHYYAGDVLQVWPLTLINAEEYARYTQAMNALAAIVKAAVLETELGYYYGIDAPLINEARALLEGDSTPTTEDQQ